MSYLGGTCPTWSRIMPWATALVCFVFGGSFEAGVPLESQLLCETADDCPSGRVCLVQTGLMQASRCVLESDPCVLVDAVTGQAAPAADGSACGQGRICLSGSCVTPRCGDGVVSGRETCDGEPGCRLDCTRCGDGVIDEGELCDEGAANSDEQPNACRTSCVPARCLQQPARAFPTLCLRRQRRHR